MEAQEVMVNGGISNGGGGVWDGNGLEQVCSENRGGGVWDGNGFEQVCKGNGFVSGDISEKAKENLAEEVLEGLEEYWEDIGDRLMISRMVSDSIIKGMVTAVEQDAAERVASKELEVANLKERLRSHEVAAGKYEDMRLPVVQKAYEVGRYGECSCSTDVCKKNEKMREDLSALRNLAREQFKKVKKEFDCVRGCNLLKKNGSGSELLGLGGILQEKQSESWTNVNEMLDCLKTTVDTVCRKVDDILLSSKISFCESRQDLDLLATHEDVVTQTVLRSCHKEFEENLLDQNAQFCGIQTMNWLEKFNDISSLGTKLDLILKSLSVPETGLASHGSQDLDHSKGLLYGENGTVDATIIHVAESYDFHQLKHMPKEELVSYFSNIIAKMKGDYESALHQKTEEYFRRKREFLKEKGSFLTHRKDEEFDVLRKKIPEVISKLENFLGENERFPALANNLESMGKLKHRLESLISENRQLRRSLTDTENEVKCLKAQVAGASSESLRLSLAEENMLKHVKTLESKLEDSYIESSLNEEVYKSAIREQIAQIRCNSEDSNMEFIMTREIYDIILGEAATPAETESRCGIEDSDIESLIIQGLNGLIFTEIINDAGRQLKHLCKKVLIDEEITICLETKALEKENELGLVVEEKEKLKQEILDLRTTIDQKEKLAMDLSVSLSKEREQLALASRELSSLREHASRQQRLITESNKDIESLRSQHLEVLEKIDIDKMEMHKLNQKLDQAKVALTETDRERNKAFALAQEMHDKLQLCEAREQTLKREMEMAANGFSKIFDDFEHRVSGAIKRNSLRLGDANSHLKDLTEMANVLRQTGLIYKQKLERRYIDLETAEAEVDLLGDEVDALLRLLEKIYIALDHYYPVLKHYPGIVEILELVRRELSGESTRLS